MALSAIDLSSQALVRLGANPIASFSEGTAEAEVALSLYASTRDALLSAHPWTFATGQATLAQLALTPIADYLYAYQLPADFLRVLSVGDNGLGRGVIYRIAERKLHTSASSVVITYIFTVDESEFPPFFDAVLIAKLSSVFCIPITESTSRADSLFKMAEAEFRKAKSVDSQQQTPGRIEDFSLIDVRG